jgi:hypothetical protein
MRPRTGGARERPGRCRRLDARSKRQSARRARARAHRRGSVLRRGAPARRLAHREQAIDYYRAASTWFGGGAETRAAATRALSRLRAAK